MKKAWSIALGAVVLLVVCVCWGGASLVPGSEEPVLTQQIKCIVLAKTNRELVVQCAERTGTELRTVRLTKTGKSMNAADGTEGVQVGDLVQLETVLHSDNTETLRTVQVLQAGEVTQQEAADMLAGVLPEAVAFAAAQDTSNDAADSVSAAPNGDGVQSTDDSAAPEQKLQNAAGTENAAS